MTMVEGAARRQLAHRELFEIPSQGTRDDLNPGPVRRRAALLPTATRRDASPPTLRGGP